MPPKISKPLDVYVRVSRVAGRGGDSFISPEVQEETCRKLAADRKLAVGKVIQDLDVSGGKMQRKGLDEAIHRIETGESGGLLVAKIDRFARTLLGGLQTLERIREAGGAVLVADIGDGEPLNTVSATGEMVLNLMLTMGQFELRRLSEGWDISKANAVERGLHGGNRAPVGYVRDVTPTPEHPKGTRKLVLDPEVAPIIREVFMRRIQGVSWGKLAAFLSESGVPTSFGVTKWSASATQYIVTNPVYRGEARSAGHVNESAHEAIVAPGEWEAAQSKRAHNRVQSEGSGALLVGLLRCAACGHSMTADRSIARDKRKDGSVRVRERLTYRCKNNTCDDRVSVVRAKIEPVVESVALERIAAEERPHLRPVLDRRKLDEAVAQATADLRAWDDNFDANDDPEAFNRGRARRKKLLLAAQSRRSEVVMELAAEEGDDGFATAMYHSGDNAELVERWPAFEIDDQRRVLAAAFPYGFTLARGKEPIEERIAVATSTVLHDARRKVEVA